MRPYILAAVLLLPHAAPAVDLDWRELPPLPDPAGVAGPFVGIHNDALIVAGGANFPEPVWDTEKAWHDDARVLVREPADGDTRHHWVTGFRLERPIAYGVSASTSRGVVCAGGNDAAQTYADAFLLCWNPASESLEREPLPSLPEPAAYAAAAAIGDTVYVAGGASGAELATATANFWSLDLSQPGSGGLAWRALPPWPGPSRALAILAAQHNGEEECLYLISGRREDDTGQVEFLRDVYEYSPRRHRADPDTAWRRVADAPRCVMAGTGIALGQSHIVVLGGADGAHYHQVDTLRDAHPGFPKEALAYHTVTNTWTSAGAMPANHVTTTAVRWGSDPANDPIIVPSGEIRPRVRSPKVWAVRPASSLAGPISRAQAAAESADALPEMYFADRDHGAPFAKDPSVVRFKGRYLLYYSVRIPGRIGIGIAESSDLTHWRKAGEFETTADYERKGVAAPAALVHEGKVHLFYQTYGNGPKDALCHAVSEDGVRFERNPTNPIFAPTGDWNAGRAIDAEVFIDGDTAFLYGATRDPEMKRQMLFVATAPVAEGFRRESWTQRCDAPVLEPELPWETNCIEAPSVIRRDGRFFMFYAGGYNNDPQQVGVAVSNDGIAWERLSDVPLLPNGPEGAWNHSESGHPGVFLDDNGETWLFFQGNNDRGKTWYLSKMRVAWDAEGLPYLIRPEDGHEFRLVRTVRLGALANPLLDLAPAVYPRDPLLVAHEGIYRVYYSAVETLTGGFQLHLAEIRSTDLVNWPAPRRLLDGLQGFSSPGSMIRHEGRWVMALQSYPIPPGHDWADDSARLWIMESGDLEQWDAPRQIKPEGCTANWARSPRQIDPCIVVHEGKFWCFYKTDGQLGLLVSDDLHTWEEALPDRPVLSRRDTPDGASVENVCLVKDGEDWTMFFSPCRDGRGIGTARSSNLLDWHDVRYVDFPPVPWADNGPTAPMLIDQRENLGVWLMVFHGERRRVNPHGAALGIAWSRDLHDWTLP